MQRVEPVVLLVEDNPAEARLLRTLIDDVAVRPIVFDHVTRLAHARARLDRGGVAAVVLDLSLPDSTGLGTIAGVEAERRGVPVIVLTSHVDPAIREGAARMGVVELLEKDAMAPRQLAYVLERLLAQPGASNALDASREAAGRTYRARAAVEFGIDCMRKLTEQHMDSTPERSLAPGVVRRTTAGRTRLQRDLIGRTTRALQAAERELDRMSELILEVHRRLLSRNRGYPDGD